MISMKKGFNMKNDQRSQDPNDYPMRLQRYLATCGLGSRRYCERLIEQAEISVNGKVIDTQGVTVNRDDEVRYQDKLVLPEEQVYIVLHKPAGYISSNADPYHTEFARDLIDIPQKNSLFHVGRLDMYSSGLLIYTNDGAFAQKMAHPSYEVEKEYTVVTSEPLDLSKLEHIVRHGITIDEVSYTMLKVTMVAPRKVRLIIKEGKNREIRKIFSYLGYQILALHRDRIGAIVLGNLPSGSYRFMTDEEIQSVLGVEHS